MAFARVDVVVDAGNLPPDQVRIAVTQPLERAFQGLPAVTRVYATSSQGSAELLVDFDPKTNAQYDLQYVDQAVSAERSVLPPGAGVQSMLVTPTSEVVIAYALRSKTISQTLLREIAQQSLIPQFYGIAGLARIVVMGGAQREYHVSLDPAQLAVHGLSADDVSQAVANAAAVSAVGFEQSHYRRSVLVVDSGLRAAADLGRVVVPDANRNPIPLSSLGTIALGVEPLTMQVSYNAQHAVAINFYSLPGADAVRMAAVVKDRMRRIQANLPAGVALDRAWDQSDLVTSSQNSLRDAILLGAVLAVLVIWLFLQNLRMTLVAAAVIPIAMAISVFAMNRMGETLNLMSVGGLAVAVGLIIDDAIVVIENVARHLHERRETSAPAAVHSAMRELASPMIASTMTTVVVFIPLLLLTGITGFFFRSLAFTLAAALLVSLVLAVFVTPAIAAWIVRPRAHDPGRTIISRILGTYEPALRAALKHRIWVYAGCAVILALTGLILSALPTEFLPQLDEGQLQIDYRMPVGTTLEASDAAALAIERVVLSDPAVASDLRVTGEDPNGFSPIQVREGKIRIRLRAGRRDPYAVVADRLRRAVSSAVPAAEFDFTQLLEEVLGDISGAPAPIEITVHGSDQNTLSSVAGRLADKLAKIQGLTDVFSGVNYDDPALRVDPNGVRLAELGLTRAGFGTLLQAQLQGEVAAALPAAASSQIIPVRIAVAHDQSGGTMVTPGGVQSLPALASISKNRLSSDITEINGQRVMIVTAGLNGLTLSDAVSRIQTMLAHTSLPPGYGVTLGGAYREQQQSFLEFLKVIAIAVTLVFFVMLATFRSYRLPLVILTAIPLALIGVALGLFVTGTPFNVSSFMGLLLLVGIVVKNGILLIDVANRRRASGATVEEALVDAGRLRLRPIVMTTAAAIGGLLPLALGIGAGAEMERPLAIAVIGGLSTATAFTLIVIPVLYAGVSRLRPERSAGAADR